MASGGGYGGYPPTSGAGGQPYAANYGQQPQQNPYGSRAPQQLPPASVAPWAHQAPPFTSAPPPASAPGQYAGYPPSGSRPPQPTHYSQMPDLPFLSGGSQQSQPPSGYHQQPTETTPPPPGGAPQKPNMFKRAVTAPKSGIERIKRALTPPPGEPVFLPSAHKPSPYAQQGYSSSPAPPTSAPTSAPYGQGYPTQPQSGRDATFKQDRLGYDQGLPGQGKPVFIPDNQPPPSGAQGWQWSDPRYAHQSGDDVMKRNQQRRQGPPPQHNAQYPPRH